MSTVKLKGGEKLERFLKDLSAKVQKGATLNVGFLEGATYPDGKSVAMVAAIQEFGAPGASIPPRPFFRTMIDKESSSWGDKLAAALEATGYDADKALRILGEDIAGALRQSIIDTNSPALSEITLMLRKMKADNPDLKITGKTVGEAARRLAEGEEPTGVSTKPLVDSGHLLGSVDYEVKS